MTEPKTTVDSRLSDQIGDIYEFGWDAEFQEVLVTGYEGVAVLTAAGEVVCTRPLPSDVRKIDQQHTPQGWRVLVRENSALSILSIPPDGSPDVLLNDSVPEPHTACWSPCGTLVAVGSVGTDLSVWDTNTGLLHWKRSIAWDVDDFLTPPKLSVKGWTPDGKRILATAEYLAALALNIWDALSGEILAFVD